MKFTLEVPDAGLNIRREILDAAGLHGGTVLEVHTGEIAVVLLKEQMTAMEMIQAIQSLKNLTSDLLVHLAKACGPCKHCEEVCPCTRDDSPIQLPDELLERAGIPKGAKLDIFADDGEITIAAATGPDLRDVQPEMVELFRQTGICLDELDGLLLEGGVVYGG